MSTKIHCTINGERHEFGTGAGTMLIDVLRDHLGLVGTKNGCGNGQCGACAVIMNNKLTRSCVTPLAKLEGASIETVESLSRGGQLHALQEAFVAEGAVQCGFCTPGMLMAAKALLLQTPQPTHHEIREALEPQLCRCTGYSAIVRAVRRAAGLPVAEHSAADAAAELSGQVPLPGSETIANGLSGSVGTSPLRKDTLAKLRGERVFAADYESPEMLHGAFVLSTKDHARLLSLNLEQARKAPGVVTILSAADIPGRNGFGLFIPHQPVFAADLVRYRGEPLALVVAESVGMARAAAKLISAEYEELPVIHSIDEAMAPGAPELHEGGNTADTVRFRRGNPEQAFADADLVIEGEYFTPQIEHAYLEPEACLAVPGSQPAVTVYTANQGSGAYQQMIAATLAIDPEQVRVVYTPAGGGFGGKEEPTVQIQAALAARLTGRPVKVVLSRSESIRMSTKRHGSRVRIRHAVRKDGTLLAVETDTVVDSGSYLSLSKPVIFRTAIMAGGPYEIPNASVNSRGVYTNTNPSGAFRGFGSTQICFAVELQMDKIARALGMDPIELRRKNALAPGKTTVTGHLLPEGNPYPETVNQVADALAAALKETAPAPGKKLGVGFASAYKNVGVGKGLPDEASAAVELREDGSVRIFVGATDMGQGSDTVMAQIAAERLGVPYGLVDVVSSDTERCPEAGLTTASRQTFVSGNAVNGAAALLLETLKKPDGMNLSGYAEEEAREALTELYEEHYKGERLRLEYRYRPPRTMPLPEDCEAVVPDHPEGHAIHFAYCYTSMAAIVEVNPDGTELRVLRLITAQDVGRALHRQNVLGQVEGAVVMGYGYGMRENFESGRNGTATTTINSLGLPRFLDSPVLETYIVEAAHPDGPYGAKGIGEIPLNPAAPAIAAAVNDALGVYPSSLPFAATLPELVSGA